jgi:hypothetical protein
VSFGSRCAISLIMRTLPTVRSPTPLKRSQSWPYWRNASIIPWASFRIIYNIKIMLNFIFI